jgi:hypothetical protein
MSFLDLYFDETNEEFNNLHSRNKNLVLLAEDDSYIKLEFSDCGENINILEHSAEDFMCHLNDKYLVNELYSVIKMNFTKENWLFILIQVIFDLSFINQYPNLKKFIKDHIYQEYTEKSYTRNNMKFYE